MLHCLIHRHLGMILSPAAVRNPFMKALLIVSGLQLLQTCSSCKVAFSDIQN